MDCALCSLGHVVEDELSWGQAAVGFLSLKCKEEQGKGLTEYFPPFCV